MAKADVDWCETAIGEMSYGQKLAELYIVKGRLMRKMGDRVGAEAELGRAEARIEETGQKYFLRELETVREELGFE